MTNMTSKELKVMAKALGVKGWWTLNKADLIAAIEAIQNEQNNDDVADVAQNDQDQPESAEETVSDEVIDEETEVEKKPRGKMIEFNGKSQTLNKWAAELGFTPQTLFARLYISNWPVEKAFTTPSRRKTSNNEEE